MLLWVALGVLPLAFAGLLTRAMISLAPRLGLLDHPAARKVHVRVTPLGGGLAIYASVLGSLGLVVLAAWFVQRYPAYAAWLPPAAPTHAAGVLEKSPLLAMIALAGTIQMFLGLVDDWRGGISYQWRLLVEVGLVIGLVTQGVRVSIYTDSLWITVPVTVLWIVGLTNALNFLDNMDGLCAGVAFWASAFFVAVASLVGSLFIAGCFLVLAGALAGFLWFNWSPARIFMGDAGSNFIGYWLGTLTVIGTYNTPGFSHVTVLAPLCILAVPLYDSTTVISLRLLQGKSPFQPDKQHLSHRLVELGFQPKNAVLLIYLLCWTTGLGGLLLYFIAPEAAALAVLQVVCLLGIIALLEVASHRKARQLATNGIARRAEPAPARVET